MNLTSIAARRFSIAEPALTAWLFPERLSSAQNRRYCTIMHMAIRGEFVDYPLDRAWCILQTSSLVHVLNAATLKTDTVSVRRSKAEYS
jgi:hypothetical protein